MFIDSNKIIDAIKSDGDTNLMHSFFLELYKLPSDHFGSAEYKNSTPYISLIMLDLQMLAFGSKLEKLYSVQKFLKNENICYSIVLKRLLYYDLEKFILTQPFQVISTIKFDDIPTAALISTLYLTSHGTGLRGFMNDGIILPSKMKRSYYTIRFKKIITKLLPSPYVTKCLNYTDLGYENHDHILEDCRRKLSLKILNSSCCGTIINTTASYSMRSANLDIRDELKFEVEITDVCNKKHPHPDCYKEKIIPILESISTYKTGEYIFIIKSPNSDDLAIDTKEKVSILDFLIYLGSVVSFWFGICVFEVFDILANLITKLSIKKNRIKNSRLPNNQFITIPINNLKIENRVILAKNERIS